MTLSVLSSDEQTIIGAILDAAFAAGYLVSVYDGEEWPLISSDFRPAIEEVIGDTDTTTLRFRTRARLNNAGMPAKVGSVFLVHGNDYDVISDCSDNHETAVLLHHAECVAERLSESRG